MVDAIQSHSEEISVNNDSLCDIQTLPLPLPSQDDAQTVYLNDSYSLQSGENNDLYFRCGRSVHHPIWNPIFPDSVPIVNFKNGEIPDEVNELMLGGSDKGEPKSLQNTSLENSTSSLEFWSLAEDAVAESGDGGGNEEPESHSENHDEGRIDQSARSLRANADELEEKSYKEAYDAVISAANMQFGDALNNAINSNVDNFNAAKKDWEADKQEHYDNLRSVEAASKSRSDNVDDRQEGVGGGEGGFGGEGGEGASGAGSEGGEGHAGAHD